MELKTFCVFKKLPSLPPLLCYSQGCDVSYVTRKPPLLSPWMSVCVCPRDITGNLMGLAQANAQNKQWQSVTSCQAVGQPHGDKNILNKWGRAINFSEPWVMECDSGSSVRYIEYFLLSFIIARLYRWCEGLSSRTTLLIRLQVLPAVTADVLSLWENVGRHKSSIFLTSVVTQGQQRGWRRWQSDSHTYCRVKWCLQHNLCCGWKSDSMSTDSCSDRKFCWSHLNPTSLCKNIC